GGDAAGHAEKNSLALQSHLASRPTVKGIGIVRDTGGGSIVPISDWPLAERPRERLLAGGAAVLSDAELLAVLLRTGVRGKSAVDLARDLLGRFKGLRGLLGADLSGFRGLGGAKRAQIEAAMELARRSLTEDLEQGAALTSPGAVRD